MISTITEDCHLIISTYVCSQLLKVCINMTSWKTDTFLKHSMVWYCFLKLDSSFFFQSNKEKSTGKIGDWVDNQPLSLNQSLDYNTKKVRQNYNQNIFWFIAKLNGKKGDLQNQRTIKYAQILRANLKLKACQSEREENEDVGPKGWGLRFWWERTALDPPQKEGLELRLLHDIGNLEELSCQWKGTRKTSWAQRSSREWCCLSWAKFSDTNNVTDTDLTQNVSQKYPAICLKRTWWPSRVYPENERRL